MKNDIKQIKNELQEDKKGIKTQKQAKLHQERLKNNLYNLILEKLELDLNYLDILEKKHDLIIETIERTKKEEEPTEAMKRDFIAFDCLPYTEKKAIKEKEQGNEEQDILDYNYLYDIFITIFTKIEKEQKLIEKYKKQEEFKKLDKIINNVIFNDLEKASKESNKTIKTLINAIDNSEYKAYLLEHIKNTCDDEFKEEHIKARIKANIKNIKDDFKNDIEEEPEEKHKLPLSWRLYFALKALEALIK